MSGAVLILTIPMGGSRERAGRAFSCSSIHRVLCWFTGKWQAGPAFQVFHLNPNAANRSRFSVTPLSFGLSRPYAFRKALASPISRSCSNITTRRRPAIKYRHLLSDSNRIGSPRRVGGLYWGFARFDGQVSVRTPYPTAYEPTRTLFVHLVGRRPAPW